MVLDSLGPAQNFFDWRRGPEKLTEGGFGRTGGLFCGLASDLAQRCGWMPCPEKAGVGGRPHLGRLRLFVGARADTPGIKNLYVCRGGASGA